MTLSIKKFVTAVAWGLAFGSTMQMILAGAYGGWAAVQNSKGRSIDEIVASRADTWTKWESTGWHVAGVVGLTLGLLGLLPGTENNSGA